LGGGGLSAGDLIDSPPSSLMFMSVVLIGLVVGVAAIAVTGLRVRPAGRLNLRRYVVAVSVLSVLLAAFAIANVVMRDWTWSPLAIALLAAMVLVAYRAADKHRGQDTSATQQ
jgi:hypothetical protein